MKKSLILIPIVLAIINFSCNQTSSKEKQSNSKFIDQKLIIPDNLEIYAPFNEYLLDSNQIANAKLKIYISLNLSCPTCIVKIQQWKELLTKLDEVNKIPFIIIGNSDDKFASIKYLSRTGKIKSFPFPFFLDKKSAFVLQNKIINEGAELDAVITDKSNIILFYNNPLQSAHAEAIFIQVIKRILNKV